MNRTRQHGFTLIELMVTLVIIAVLAAIAYPAYQDNVRKSRRAECQGTLVALAAGMERYFTTNGSYLGATPAGVHAAQCPGDNSGPATYTLSIASNTTSTFVLNATPTGAQAGDPCATLTLNQLGVKGVSGASQTAAACW